MAAFNFLKIRNPHLRSFLEDLFDTSTGHDHDGVNSASLSASATIENDAVTEAKIADGAVTEAKIADGAVTEDKIGAGAVVAAKLGASAVETAKIANDAVDKDKINADVAGTGLAQNVDGSLELNVDDSTVEVDGTNGLQIKALGVDTAQIAADAIDGTKLADDAVDSEHITDGSVDRAHLAADIVDGTKIDDDAVDSEHIAAGAIDTEHIANDQVTNDKLANMTQGTVKVGGASNAPTDLDASTDGQILVGDGTDINSVAVSGDVTMANDGEVTIADGAVTLAKMDDLARGSILVGGADDAVTAVAAKTDGQILVGDGDDLASVAVSGDVTIANTGEVTIANDAVETAMIADGNVTSAKIDPEYMKVAVADLSSGNSTDFCLNWQNPESSAIIVHRVIVDITTAGGTGGALLDLGTATSNGITSDNLIDGGDLNSIHLLDNIDDQGSNGESKQKLDENGGSTDYITGQITAENAASLAGKVYIYYTAVPSA